MKNPNGFHVDVVDVPAITKTYMSIRINVDNYEEAYDFFMSKGFRQAKGFVPNTTQSSKYAYLVSPTGTIIDISEHIKKKPIDTQNGSVIKNNENIFTGGNSMKITTFNPQIITKDAEPLVKLFEELGFEKKHNPTGIGELDVTGIRMKDKNGFALDLSVPNADIPQDITSIRMNVDNFDEAYELLVSHGFKNYYGDHIVERDSSKSALMIAPSGFSINLVQHIKDHD